MRRRRAPRRTPNITLLGERETRREVVRSRERQLCREISRRQRAHHFLECRRRLGQVQLRRAVHGHDQNRPRSFDQRRRDSVRNQLLLHQKTQREDSPKKAGVSLTQRPPFERWPFFLSLSISLSLSPSLSRMREKIVCFCTPTPSFFARSRSETPSDTSWRAISASQSSCAACI